MRYVYDKPLVKIRHWLVTKNDLERIYSFFGKRTKSNEVSFKLETESGNNREYASFDEFRDDVDSLLKDNENISLINIGSSEYGEKSSKHAWISINFKGNTSFFALTAEAPDDSLKDWVEGTYSEMNKMAGIFEQEEGALWEAVAKQHGSSWDKDWVLFDGDSLLRAELEENLKSETPQTRP